MYNLIIVEDNMELVEGIRTLIDWEAINVDVQGDSKNGLLGLELALKVLPDIIITDISMPYMDGLEFVKRIREHQLKSKVIILSGYDNFTYAQKAIKYGVMDYLLKPSKPDEIFQAVKKAILLINEEQYNQKLIENYKTKIQDNVSGLPVHAHEKQDCEAKSIDNKNSKMIVDSAIEYINENYSHEITLQKVADHIFISPAYLSTLFKQEIDINFVDYIHKFRMQKAMEFLRETHYKNYEIATLVGYHDEKYFFQIFKKYVGLTPSEYRKMIK